MSWMRAEFHGLGAVIFKEVRHIMREPATLAMVIAMPLMQLLIYGYAINLHVQHVRTVYYNEDGRQLPSNVVSELERSGEFTIVGQVQSKDALVHAIVANTARVGFDVPKDFEASVGFGEPLPIAVYIDGSDLNIAQVARAAADRLGEALERKLAGAKPLPAIVQTTILFNPTLRTPNFLIPGLIGLVIQNIAMVLMTLSIINERERGTLDQVMVTPIGSVALLLGKITPYAVITFVDFVLVLAIMRAVFLVPIAGNVWLLLVLGIGFLMTSLGLGLLVSIYAQSQLQAALITVFFLLPSFLLSGMFFEIELMPPVMQVVSHLLPLTYFLEVLRAIINRGAGLIDIWFPAVMTVVFGVAVLCWASLRFARITN